MVLIDQEEIVKVAAHLFRRVHAGIDIEFRTIREGWEGARQHRLLNTGRQRKLGADALFLRGNFLDPAQIIVDFAGQVGNVIGQFADLIMRPHLSQLPDDRFTVLGLPIQADVLLDPPQRFQDIQIDDEQEQSRQDHLISHRHPGLFRRFRVDLFQQRRKVIGQPDQDRVPGDFVQIDIVVQILAGICQIGTFILGLPHRFLLALRYRDLNA